MQLFFKFMVITVRTGTASSTRKQPFGANIATLYDFYRFSRLSPTNSSLRYIAYHLPTVPCTFWLGNSLYHQTKNTAPLHYIFIYALCMLAHARTHRQDPFHFTPSQSYRILFSLLCSYGGSTPSVLYPTYSISSATVSPQPTLPSETQYGGTFLPGSQPWLEVLG